MKEPSQNTFQHIILNFTDIYSHESFYRHRHFTWIDCQDIMGTDCLCDSDAAREIKHRIAPFGASGLHFIDSGNYHYISKFWTDKIRQPFVLVVFDHHPDMQPPLFQNILSCGSWVKIALDTNPNLQKVVLVGADDLLLQQVDSRYQDRMTVYSESTLHHAEAWRRFASIHVNVPVYISVDKDVLSEQDEQTNWDQGSLHLDELKSLLKTIIQHSEVIGMDVCGACPLTISQMVGQNEINEDNHVNAVLWNLSGG